MNLTVTPAAEAERSLIAGLFQFYVYDFSEMEPDALDKFQVGPDGLFAVDPYLDAYWSEAGRWPLLFRRGEAVVGFALVNQVSHRDEGFVERNMAEFFLMRQHRRGGLATEALRQVLNLHPGRWEVAVLARNSGALAFWPRALEVCGVDELECLEGDGDHWTGPIWTFTR